MAARHYLVAKGASRPLKIPFESEIPLNFLSLFLLEQF